VNEIVRKYDTLFCNQSAGFDAFASLPKQSAVVVAVAALYSKYGDDGVVTVDAFPAN
jgi:hypothetical protein